MTGTPVLAFDGEYLVELSTGNQLTIFFEDGFVRQYVQEESCLVEMELNSADMAELRIEDAELRLRAASPEQWPDSIRREKQLHFILSGMVDLFHLAAQDEEVRKNLAQLFFNLPVEQLTLIHRKLVAVLHQRDPILAYAFSEPASASTVMPMKPGNGAEAAQKRALAEKKKAQKRQADQDRRVAMRGDTGGSGQKKRK